MSEDLYMEVEAINSIYGEGSLSVTETADIYILQLPGRSLSLRVQFPPQYPVEPPAVLGMQTSGDNARKGDGTYVVDIFRDTLRKLFSPGEVCLFDVMEEVNTNLDSVTSAEDIGAPSSYEEVEKSFEVSTSLAEPPPWTLSDVVIEMKSVFVARAAPVFSTEQAQQFLEHLLDSDRKVRSAAHNITAWRIKGPNGVTYQDCDDDGETAAGSRVLHLLQVMDVWNVMVIVTRWYGGHQLGPKRFSIINIAARNACVKGGFVPEEPAVKKGKH
ncbi:ribosomal protein S5 domain 2-type protein [Calycina marina]|uniref:Ribosomal protein S5 domain 2-type protein n=1 Tax=Calycina marina TaxID=1763456 RepID=A0A9P7Z5F5_9HELO|nr:ribosomal protein S5 domain 2-type protein [Calycina marina]